MTKDAVPTDRSALVVAAVSALEQRFGARARAVVERQIENASGESLKSWKAILAGLRDHQDPRQ